MHAEFTTATIVMVGSFDPDAFRPSTLADLKVISQKEAKASHFIMLLPGAGVQFSLSWGEVLVSSERFQISANQAPFVRIADLVLKAFRELPSKANITAFGINVESHFDLQSLEARDALGQRLAPPGVWGEWGANLLKSMKGPYEQHGGMAVLQMRQRFAEKEVLGWLDVRVEPSPKIANNAGVLFRTNHHHQLPEQAVETDGTEVSMKTPRDGLALLDVLAERFDDSILTASNIFQSVLSVETK